MLEDAKTQQLTVLLLRIISRLWKKLCGDGDLIDPVLILFLIAKFYHWHVMDDFDTPLSRPFEPLKDIVNSFVQRIFPRMFLTPRLFIFMKKMVLNVLP